jgi:hypothetical protein
MCARAVSDGEGVHSRALYEAWTRAHIDTHKTTKDDDGHDDRLDVARVSTLSAYARDTLRLVPVRAR